MRSLPSLVLALLVAACGNDIEPPDGVPSPDEEPPDLEPARCDTSYLDYGNFGEPFALDWCRGCHSSSVPAGMRQKAPMGVNFDTHADVQQWKERILIRAGGNAPTMPPAGGPSADERALLAEWLACGAK